MTISDNRIAKFFIIAGLVLLLSMSGCASSLQYGTAKITSTPAGAEVINLKDDSSLGITPVRVSFNGEAGTAEFITVQIRKRGYADRITSFWINRRHDSVSAAEDNAIDLHVELEKSTDQ